MVGRSRPSDGKSPSGTPPTRDLAGRLGVSAEQLRSFCRRWKVIELALFGSVLGDGFGPNSDVDVLVRWAPDATWGLLDHVQMEEELGRILGRRVDLLSRRAVESSSNRAIRQSILDTAEPIYVA